MTTYNLDLSTLKSTILDVLKPQTATAIEKMLNDSGLLPTGGSGTINVTVSQDAGPFVMPNSGELYLFTGTGTAQVLSAGGNILADPGNINDYNYGAGADTLVGGSGFVAASKTGNNYVYADTGAGVAAATLWAGAGNDTVVSAGGNAVLFAGTGLQQRITGGQTAGAADTMYGGSGSNTISSAMGNNTFYGGTGAMTMISGSGNDTIWTGGNFNSILAGTGNDVIHAGKYEFSHDTIYGGSAHNILAAATGSNLFYGGTGAMEIYGGSGNDTIWTGGDSNYINAGAGDDVVHAGRYSTSRDTVIAGDGNENLAAAAGNNAFVLGSGNATLTAGVGRDTVYAGSTAGNATIMGSGATQVELAANPISQTTVGGVTTIVFSNNTGTHHLVVTGADIHTGYTGKIPG